MEGYKNSMGKSIFTMSAAQRLKAQEKQSKRFDRAVNRKFKEMKKAWKKKMAGKVFKGAAFVATAAAAGAVFGKAKEIMKNKSSDELREMASKIKVKFDEKMAARKEAAKDGTTAQDAAERLKNMTVEPCAGEQNETVKAHGTTDTMGDWVAPEKAAEEINQSVE